MNKPKGQASTELLRFEARRNRFGREERKRANRGKQDKESGVLESLATKKRNRRKTRWATRATCRDDSGSVGGFRGGPRVRWLSRAAKSGSKSGSWFEARTRSLVLRVAGFNFQTWKQWTAKKTSAASVETTPVMRKRPENWYKLRLAEVTALF
ncbi:hypothetical protein GW17_00014098 [Ensete ventricosum]|nr:hypothetical protein GW17_00014098 [Ensete ventricosum]